MGENLSKYIFCSDCGKKLSVNAKICPECGNPINKNFQSSFEDNSDRFFITLLLCWFLGLFGIHRFYTGHNTIGIIQLLTLGGFGIWTLIDFIIILTGGFKDSDGKPIKYK